ncbi:MAG: extracellular solute-binding protein [Caldilineaceae bacterium]
MFRRPYWQQKKITRRTMLQLTAGAAGASLLSACVPTAQTSAPSSASAPVAAAVDSVVPKAASGGLSGEVVVGIMAGPEADAHIRLAPQFGEMSGGKLTSRVEDVGRDVWSSRWLTNFQSQSNEWDAVNIQNGPFKLAGPAGFLLPLNDYIDNPELLNKERFNLADWPQALLDLFTIDGKLYEFPQEASTLMFYYRTDLLEKYGIEPPGPQGYSWDELIANCRIAKEKIAADGLEETYPLLFGTKRTHSSIHFQQIAWSYGADLFVDGKMPNFNSPEAIAALEAEVSWVRDEGLVTPGMVGYEYPEVLTAYQQGKAVFALQWNAAAPDILNPEKSPASAGKTAFSVFPWQVDKGPEQLRLWPSVWSMGVSAFSSRPEEAFEYIAWFTSKEVARDYVMNGGGSSGRQSLLTDPEILASNPQFGAMGEGFKVYHAMPDLVSYDFINTDILPAHLQAVWQGEVSAKEGLDAATEEAKQYLSDKGEI